MAYSELEQRRQYQRCDNCIFIRSCFVQELQRLQETFLGNDCFFYQDERDIPARERTTRYIAVKDMPAYDLRIRKPART